MDIYLVRHTSVDIEKGICYGWSDIKINEELFEEELASVMKNIPSEKMVIYTSALSRCKRLAERLPHTKLIEDSNFNETNYGDWEMKKWSDIGEEAMTEYIDNFVYYQMPNGESYQEVFNRVSIAYEGILEQHLSKNDTIIIVTHSGVIAAIIAYILELPIEKSALFNLEYGSVSKFQIMKDYKFVNFINRK